MAEREAEQSMETVLLDAEGVVFAAAAVGGCFGSSSDCGHCL